MALLKYIGNSPYGTTITLSDLKTIVTVTKSQPHLVDISSEEDIRYYKSLESADIVLEVSEATLPKVKEEVEVEVVEEEVVVEETIEVSEETIELSDEEVVEKLLAMTDDEFSDLVSKLNHKSKKRNRSAIAWELVGKFQKSELI